MVYLEEQSTFLQRLKGSPLAPLLNEILYEQVADHSLETHNANDVATNLIICVKTGNKAHAKQIFTQFSKRQYNKDSHWIYDNFIVFCIVCAVHKFKLNADWIIGVINLTYSKANLTDKRIKDSFKNILAGNYNSKGDYHQISLVYQFLAKDEMLDNDRLNEMYVELWEATFPFTEDDFLNVISLKAIEIAFLKKALLNPHEFILMNHFVPIFKRRTEIFANILSWILIALITIGSFYMLWLLFEKSTTYPLLSKALFFLLSISGFGVSIFWGWKKGLSKFILIVVNKTFGYPKEK